MEPPCCFKTGPFLEASPYLLHVGEREKVSERPRLLICCSLGKETSYIIVLHYRQQSHTYSTCWQIKEQSVYTTDSSRAVCLFWTLITLFVISIVLILFVSLRFKWWKSPIASPGTHARVWSFVENGIYNHDFRWCQHHRHQFSISSDRARFHCQYQTALGCWSPSSSSSSSSKRLLLLRLDSRCHRFGGQMMQYSTTPTIRFLLMGPCWRLSTESWLQPSTYTVYGCNACIR